MSATADQVDRLNLDEQIVRIEQMIAETAKLNAETTKFTAEATKLRRDRVLSPWQVAFTGMGAGAAILAAGAAIGGILVKVLGG